MTKITIKLRVAKAELMLNPRVMLGSEYEHGAVFRDAEGYFAVATRCPRGKGFGACNFPERIEAWHDMSPASYAELLDAVNASSNDAYDVAAVRASAGAATVSLGTKS